MIAEVKIEDVRRFWDGNPCNSWLSKESDRRRYFSEIESTRYRIEPHIPVVAKFEDFRGKDVLEIGCGVGTDGMQFAKHGAHYTAFDLSPVSLGMTKERFDLSGLEGRFENGNAEELPFPDESFDHVYSFGVIHSSPDTEAIARQIHRVLRPGGTFCVMVYNTTSINYKIEIMFLRRVLRPFLSPKFMPRLISKLTGLDEWKLEGHRKMMMERPRLEKQEWINMNTDGPWCPLAKVYNAKEALELFGHFSDVMTEAWHFDRSHWPLIGKLIPDGPCHWLGRRWGWHRIITGRKPVNESRVESQESRAAESVSSFGFKVSS